MLLTFFSEGPCFHFHEIALDINVCNWEQNLFICLARFHHYVGATLWKAENRHCTTISLSSISKMLHDYFWACIWRQTNHITFRTFHIVLIALNYCRSNGWNNRYVVHLNLKLPPARRFCPATHFIPRKIYIKYTVAGSGPGVLYSHNISFLSFMPRRYTNAPEPCGHTEPVLRASSQDVRKNKVY